MPEELVIDQDKLMVVSDINGYIIYIKDFKYFIEEMDLKMYVCKKADPGALCEKVLPEATYVALNRKKLQGTTEKK